MSEKKLSQGYKVLIGFLIILVAIFGYMALFGEDDSGISKADYDLAVENARTLGSTDKDGVIASLQEQVAGLIAAATETVEDIEAEIVEGISALSGYLIDELFLEDPFGEVLSDRELEEILFDGKVNFDGENYEAEETFTTDGLIIKANEDDFEGNAYLVVLDGTISYSLVFENSLNTSLIGDDDETLVFDFLGNEIEVSEWDGDEIIFAQGNEYTMTEGQILTLDDGTEVELKYTFEDSVYVKVGEDSKEVQEGQVKTLDGLDIKVVYAFEATSYREGMAKLIIGEEIEREVSDGDEYEDDSIWEWAIDANSIGLVLDEEFLEIDEDEDNKALAIDERVCLPNDYVCVVFNGLGEEDSEEISFELETEDGVDYVEVNGNFQSELEDYEVLYINETGIYDEDFDEIIGEITIDDFDVIIDANDVEIIIKDEEDNVLFTLNLDLNESSIAEEDIDDVDYLTDYGILVDNPEDSIDDKEWNIVIPEYQLEGSISII